MDKIINGLDRLGIDPDKFLGKANLGLVANQASVGQTGRTANNLEHAVTIIDRALPGRLKTFFGPQHGFLGEKQDNMVESDHDRERAGRNVFSLYGQTRRPEPEMFEGLDILLIDLVDVGTRVYTFAHTMSYCLEAAADAGIKVMILDRPNPIGGSLVEGNLLKPAFESFVGLHPIPMRHGMTMGELARYIAATKKLNLELEVIEVSNLFRKMSFPDTGQTWVMPSPNMPSYKTALVYPGQVLLEGTNLSEGRGTTRPFLLFGAPYIDSIKLKEELDNVKLPGVFFRPISFEPTFNKHMGKLCHGLEIHPLSDNNFRPFRTTIAILSTIINLYPEEFSWSDPPYEYEFKRRPFDLITGDSRIRSGLEKGLGIDELEAGWNDELIKFLEEKKKYHLYD